MSADADDSEVDVAHWNGVPFTDLDVRHWAHPAARGEKPS